MYRSPDTPEAVKRMQQKIWMDKTIQERITLSMQMIDDARSMQTHGLKMRNPHWTDEDIRIYRLKRMMKNYPSLTWLDPIIQQLEAKNRPNTEGAKFQISDSKFQA
jgi:hypothetical protein